MPVKDYYHDIDLHANQLFNSRLHNISTAARITLGGSLGVSDKGYQVYDTDLLTPYFWDGTAWQAAGGSGTVWGSITGDIVDQTDLTSYLANNYYPLLSNPAGYLDSTAGDLLYYPLSLNPANYLDATAAGLLYYPLSSNPAGYLTSESDPVFTAWLATPPNISIFTNNAGYLTSLGSGTTNYVTKWTTGGTVLGDSLIYDNGTNVGIGTVSPTHKLDVSGTINSSSTISAVTSLLSPNLHGGILTTSTLTLSGTSQTSDASTIYIQPNAGSILVGKTSGTTSGTFKVVYRDVAGSTLGNHFGLYNNEIATTNKGGSIAFGDNAGNNTRAFIKGAFAGAGSGGYLALSTNSSANTITEALRINYTQNVMIGTITDGGYKLDVNGTVRAQNSFTLGSSLYASASEGTAGQVLTSGGTGVSPSWTTIPSLTGYVPYTGATSDVNLGEWGLSQLGYAQFDITPSYTTGAVGKMVWNDTDGTLDLGLKGGNVTLQVGQEQVARVVNKTTPLVDLLEANYQVCLVTGATGQRLSVRLAQGDVDANSAGTLGVVTETILKNQEGFITISGQVHNINTTGSLQGETWNDGDVLYLSPTTAGAITNVKPTAPQHSVIIGYVEYAHAINGKIFVKIDNGYELEELHNVYAPSPSNKDGIFWNSATLRYENNSIAGILGYTPADDSTVVHKTGVETITGAKTFNTSNVTFGTTIYDVTNDRITYSGATGTGRINLLDTGTTVSDGIVFGDMSIYRGSTSTIKIGRSTVSTSYLSITTDGTGTWLFGTTGTAPATTSKFQLTNGTSTSNPTITIGDTTVNTVIKRNINDANTCLVARQTNASATGNILDLSNSGGVVTSFNISGNMSSPLIKFGTGSPEGVVTAGVGCLYSRTNGGAGTTLYVKESGTGNTGWVAK